MKYTRKWMESIASWCDIAVSCQSLTDSGWSVHTIISSSDAGNDYRKGVIIVAFKDEPDLSGGVPR